VINKHHKTSIECKDLIAKVLVKEIDEYICPVCGIGFEKKGQFWDHIKDGTGKFTKTIHIFPTCTNEVNQSNLDKLYDTFKIIFIDLFNEKSELLVIDYIDNLLGQITKASYDLLVKLVIGEVDLKDIYQDVPKEFSELSIELTDSLSKEYKKKGGIFFTHPSIVNQIIQGVQLYDINIMNVLEPSCGSCEFITQLHTLLPNASIDGVEYDKQIYDKISHLNSNNISIINEDFLQFETNKNYELILGNPPYFVIKKSDCSKEYHPYLDGRPNIYLLFILRSLSMLSQNGIVVFVLPSNFLNCSYYNKVRKYIHEKFTLVKILDCSNEFLDTDQPTNIIMIQNKLPIENNPYVLSMNNSIIFNTIDGIERITELCKDSVTLDQLGFDVHVGNVVWNQVKTTLTDDNNKTRLVYSSDFKDNKLVVTKYKDPKKKNYIEKEGITGPLLVVNRGYGKGKYCFNYCLIDIGDKPFLIENHVICIKYRDEITKIDLLNLYRSIIESFKNPKTKEFIDCYFTNDAINTTELQHILPIYV